MIPVQQRRWIARAVKLGLVGLALVVVMAWIHEKRDGANLRVHVDDRTEVRTTPAVQELASGDVRIFNQDSSVNLILRGAEILAGLSPQMQQKIQQEIVQSTSDDTTGFGAAIAGVVRTTVASAIGTHAVYPLSGLRDIEYSNGRLIMIRTDGRRVELLGNVKTDGEEVSRTFAREDAEAFVEAVRERKRELGQRR